MSDDAIPGDVRAHILKRLNAVEAEEGVRILFAIESGSRAWGFASPDSDYDVRFVYQHPTEWYLSLKEPRDVIERGLDEFEIDLAGWDLRKSLRLLLKWNSALHEWLVSPITYVEDRRVRDEMEQLYRTHADLRTMGHHYLNLARTEWNRMRDSEDVSLKKYFYVLRPLLALRWLDRSHTVPPMNFEALRTDDPWSPEVNAAVDDLIELKRRTAELGRGAHVPVVDIWIEEMLGSADPGLLPKPESSEPARVSADTFFRKKVLKI